MSVKYFGDVKETKGKLHINASFCKGCCFCVEYCPRDVLEMSKAFNKKGYHPPVVVNEDKCCYCQLCEILCPEFAIFVTRQEEVLLLTVLQQDVTLLEVTTDHIMDHRLTSLMDMVVMNLA